MSGAAGWLETHAAEIAKAISDFLDVHVARECATRIRA
jgi:hypothetical protein